MNPFVDWIEGGRRWRCNLCVVVNDTPAAYFSPTDANGLRADAANRPELFVFVCFFFLFLICVFKIQRSCGSHCACRIHAQAAHGSCIHISGFVVFVTVPTSNVRNVTSQRVL